MGRTAILIAGPTASGKSALAIRIARAVGGAVINADSMQVYRDLRILTARPTPAEEAAVPHRLFGHVDGATNFSVGRYIADARATLSELDGAGAVPIFVGGTGLYYKALTDGLSDLPPVPDEIRAAIRARAESLPTVQLHAELTSCDPATASRLRPSDRSRVLRALEIHAAAGTSLSALQGARRPGPLAGDTCLAVFLAVDRTVVRERIDRRFAAMMEAGALDEARSLAERRLDPALPVMRAHGVPGLLRHLAGELPLAEAIARGQADTRAYAKRQVTWFRHQMAGFRAVDPDAAYDEIMRDFDAVPGAAHRPTGRPSSG